MGQSIQGYFPFFVYFPKQGPQEGATEYQEIFISKEKSLCHEDVNYLNVIVKGFSTNDHLLLSWSSQVIFPLPYHFHVLL
jgi:hypothetical protein